MLFTPLFANRTEAGRQLAEVIQRLLQQRTLETGVQPIPIIYALPRGGLAVAAPVADLLGCPLTIVVAKKISHPDNPELAIGAVTAGGSVLWADLRKLYLRQSFRSRDQAVKIAMQQAQSLQLKLSFACPQVNTEGSTMILIDDGIATGMTIAAAANALRKLLPAEIWLCAPVAPFKLLPCLQEWGDRVITLATPEPFISVSHFYRDFPQLTTEEALSYLESHSEYSQE
ncbi:phosphoribosyltransferase [Calothrix sp. 336/3]|uniref:phosphoribosyltransferase n=1 Tax=Calothrix sp. 336/3 TaxID=1337936 RepID=UPI0004E37B46|nr:phosphoribosyltransferase family protein [Calothrix sp. 336/3]AKG24188.1 phosphoribosyltransferase [Calothrix sp. 336/3]